MNKPTDHRHLTYRWFAGIGPVTSYRNALFVCLLVGTVITRSFVGHNDWQRLISAGSFGERFEPMAMAIYFLASFFLK